MAFPEETMKWMLNTNGASNKNRVGIGVVLENSSEFLIEEAIWLEKDLANNEVEYEALIYGLELATNLETQHLEVNLDSELVFGHLIGTFEAKDSWMKQYCDKAQMIISQFQNLKVRALKR